MVEQSAGSPIGGVNRTEEAPGLWEQLAHRSGAHLTEEGSTVHTAEVGQVTKVVQLVCNNSEPRLLEGDYEGGRGEEGRERGGEGEREREGRARGTSFTDKCYGIQLTWGVSSVGCVHVQCVQCGVCPVWGVTMWVCPVCGVSSVGCVQCGVCSAWGVSPPAAG